MKRAVDAVLAAAVAVAFVVCVEFFLMRWRRRRGHIQRVAVAAPARLRVRRATDGVRAIFAIEGVLDDLSARTTRATERPRCTDRRHRRGAI